MVTELDALRQLAGTRYEVQVVAADIEHIMEHTGIDEPTGTWTGGGCPRHGREIGADVDLADLGAMHRQSAGLTDMRWYPSLEAAGIWELLNKQMLGDAQREPHEHTFEWWKERIAACWSYIWAANHDFIHQAEEPARKAGAGGFLVASFEHNSSAHGRERPHIHNLVPRRQ